LLALRIKVCPVDITHLEGKNEGLKFARIDTDLSDIFKEETSEDELKDATYRTSSSYPAYVYPARKE